MRVFLFGLSPRRINLINLKFKLIQLVLSILVFKALRDVSFYVCVFMLMTRFSIHTLSNRIYRYTCASLIHWFSDFPLISYVCLCSRHWSSVLWFFPVLMLSVYMWRYFRPAYVRHSNVSVPMGSGRYKIVSEPKFSHP